MAAVLQILVQVGTLPTGEYHRLGYSHDWLPLDE